MGFALELALRYMRSTKRASVSVGTLFATLGVALGVAALATVVSVTGGFRNEFRQKVLGVNAHVLVMKYSSDFREYPKIMEQLESIDGITGMGPFVINPMMVTHDQRTVTGVLVKGVDPARIGHVLDLPRHIVMGSIEGLRSADAKPPARRRTKAPVAKPKDAEEAAPSAGVLEDIRALLDEPKEEPPKQVEEPEPSDDAADVGNAVPKGGFSSVLPEEDWLPEELTRDPCQDPDSVRKLPGIIIGVVLAQNLSVGVGGCVQVTSPTIGYTYSGGALQAPVAKQFRVIAIFDAGFDQYDSKLAYTDLYQAQAFYDAGDSVNGIEMKVRDIEHARDIARQIEVKLANGVYYTLDWEQLNHGLFTALRIQQILMSLVLALIIVVAAFTVIATLIMVVLDKRKEIAVLKAMGASNGMLLASFLYQGAIIGITGAVIGLLCGVAVCRGLLVYGFPLDPKVYFISKLPVEMRAGDFALVGLFAIAVCVVATLWPALYAARLRPADAFRAHD
jgi:lipoprotein-releasing system permease protein